MSQTADELNEENREVILRMAKSGDDLSRPRDIDFSIVFPDRSSAEEFASRLRQLGYRTSTRELNVAPDLPWDVTVVKHMLPVCEAITEFELLLQAKASSLGGRNDG
ncbi:MAG TPA: ribonuclease E inhibitor RraB [Dongiaceae bacterium]|jgi:hypothetical protein|nr:ribonuclease E inhibitor RraB [Dongiaceae bacterium]